MSYHRLFVAGCIVLLLGSSVLAGGRVVVVDRGVVFEDPNADPYDPHNQFGFNHAPSITRLADGRLLAAWFSGPFEASVHQVILGSYGSSDGTRWESGVVLNDQPRRSDFDPAFITDGRRTWMFYSVGRWNRYPFVGGRDKEKTEVGIDSFKTFMRYTDDSGRSWSDEQRIGDHTGIGPRSNGVRLSSGELILPLHHYQLHQPHVLKSDDGGNTWRRIEGPVPEEKVGAAEPSIAECKSGKLLLVGRSRDGFLWTSESTDKGETWSRLHRTEMPAAASSHSLIALSDGRLLLTHNPTKPPLRTSLTARVSVDEGATWGEPTEIASVEPAREDDEVYSRQVAYPSAVVMPDGTVMLVWTQISISPSQQSGRIHWARLRVE